MRLRLTGWLCVAMLFGALCQGAFAQTVHLEGRVTDPLGGAINGAVVTLTGQGAATNTTRTGVDGTFSPDAVPAGTLTLRVEAAGFEPANPTVAASATMAPMTVVLQIAGIVESVGVVAPKLEEDLPQLI